MRTKIQRLVLLGVLVGGLLVAFPLQRAQPPTRSLGLRSLTRRVAAHPPRSRSGIRTSLR
jgi:hypothetical protein